MSRSPLSLIVPAALAFACGSSPVAPRASVPNGCADAHIAVQVLGSGGPIADGRASAGYLVWVDGHARAMVDAGPGTLLRFGESGAAPQDLEVLLLSHLHVDHSADLDGFLKNASFGRRRAPLPLYGPSGTDAFPSITGFLQALLGAAGAYRYLGGYLGEGQPFQLEPHEVDVTHPAAEVVHQSENLRVRAVGVPHGPVPALAYELTVDGRRIVFMGDQRADESRYVEMAQDADLLIAHMAIGPDSGGVAARLHAAPARLGEVAAEANVSAMVLSHLMARSLRDLNGNLQAIRHAYPGPVVVAEDGLCVPVQ